MYLYYVYTRRWISNLLGELSASVVEQGNAKNIIIIYCNIFLIIYKLLFLWI